MGSLYNKGTPVVPFDHEDEKVHRRMLAEGVRRALSGLLNNVSASTKLKHNGNSTTVSDYRAGPESLIVLMPDSENGSFALSRWWVDNQTSGQFLIHHGSTSTSDATMRYAIFG
jgi:hypothetical protein